LDKQELLHVEHFHKCD